MDTLPNDILCIIVELIDNARDLSSCLFLNKSIKNLFNNEIFLFKFIPIRFIRNNNKLTPIETFLLFNELIYITKQLHIKKNKFTLNIYEINVNKTKTKKNKIDKSSNDLNAYKKINKIPRSINKYVNLTELDVSVNDITNLPDELWTLKKIRILSLFDNSIKIIDNDLVTLTNLKVLILKNNPIIVMPFDLTPLINLDSIILDNISYDNINNIKYPISLTNLSIGYNSESSIPENIFELTNLKTLTMNNNRLFYIPDRIYNLKNLTTLDVSHNEFKDFPVEICRLRNLQYLFIDISGDIYIPDKFVNLTSLRIMKVYDSTSKKIILHKDVYRIDRCKKLFRMYFMRIICEDDRSNIICVKESDNTISTITQPNINLITIIWSCYDKICNGIFSLFKY
jgi:Leucine rich repeat